MAEGEGLNDKLTNLIQIGYVTSGTLPASTDTDFTVTFNRAFAHVPKVMATYLANTAYADRVAVITQINDISTTGFSFKILNPHTSAVNLSSNRRVVWLAVDC